MEIRLENFKGIKKSSRRRELDIPDPSYLREAKNIVIANDGSIHCHTGNVNRTPSGTGAFDRIFYSRALDRYITINSYNGDVKVHAVDSVGVWTLETTHAAAILQGTDVIVGFGHQLVDWPLTSCAYIIAGGSGGSSNIYKLSSSGVTLTTISAPANPQCIAVHKDTLWISSGSTLYPSDDLTPETFDTNNSMTISKGNSYISWLASTNGVLYAHKKNNISAIVGDTFVGTAADSQILDLDTGIGALRPSAGYVYKGLMWFIGPNGFNVCNGEKVKFIGDRLNLQSLRKAVV